MDFMLKISKSFIPKLNKREWFSYSNYFRYEEAAKIRLCANEFRKLKSYVDYFKYLVYVKMNNDILRTAIKSNKKKIKPIYTSEPGLRTILNRYKADTKRTIAILLIIQTEDRIENLISRKITINSSDQQHLGNLLKLFKNLNPEVFLHATLLREKRNSTLTRDIMKYHLSEKMWEHILTLGVKPNYKLVWILSNELDIVNDYCTPQAQKR